MMTTQELAAKQTKDMERQLPDQVRALTWNHVEYESVRNERLKTLLTYAKKYSPWYKDLLSHIDVANFRFEMLTDIPVMDKKILMANWDKIVTSPSLSLSIVEDHINRLSRDENALYLQDRYHVMVTSGTSGQRGVYIYDWDEWNTYYLQTRRFRLADGKQASRLFNPTKKFTISVVAAINAIHGMYSLAQTFKTRNAETYHFPITLPVEEIVAGLNQTQPDVLQACPSSIYKLCPEVLNGKLKIQPKVISLGGEPFYAPIRAEIEKAWPGVAIFNTYGTSEGLMGINCRANSKEMHLNDDFCIVEPFDHFGTPITKGGVADKIYITNLYNYTLPLIRYEMQDKLIFLNKACPCGVRHQLIAEPQGRPELDFFYSDNIYVHHITFVSPLLLDKNIREYQVIQTPSGANINILAMGIVDKNHIKALIIDKLTKLGLADPVINLNEVSKFEYSSSGKLKRFIPLG